MDRGARTTPAEGRGAIFMAAGVALLLGPVVLAFFSGGYFSGPRVWAGLVAWLLVGIAAVVRRPVPQSGPARVAVAGLALLAAWTLLSFLWAPLAGTAYGDGQRVILYLGALIAAAALLRGRLGKLAVPAITAGTTLVLVYGISERLAPWLLTFHHSASARGRLEQPLTYWNAMGALAAMGVVLCASLAGDRQRPDGMRIAAAVAVVPLGLGLYISFSRGALYAAVAGLIALLVIGRTRSTIRAIGLVGVTAVAACVASAPFGAVTSLKGSHATRVSQGTIVLAILVAIAVAAAFAQRAACRAERSERLRTGPLKLPRHAGWLALIAVVAGFVVFLSVGAKEKSSNPTSAGANRLTSLESNRYAYWRVAWRAFEAEPIRGVGGGGWAVYWLRYRPYDTGAQDAHSLYIQTAAELGIVGLAFLGATFAGVALAGRRALLTAPSLAAGPLAGLVVWATHAAVDWDWEMPALTLQAILLAGAVLALSDVDPRSADAASVDPEPREVAAGTAVAGSSAG